MPRPCHPCEDQESFSHGWQGQGTDKKLEESRDASFAGAKCLEECATSEGLSEGSSRKLTSLVLLALIDSRGQLGDCLCGRSWTRARCELGPKALGFYSLAAVR